MSSFQWSQPQPFQQFQQSYVETYDLPPLFNFYENSNEYNKSKYAEVIGKVIQKIVSKSDNTKVFNAIEYGFTAIETYIKVISFYFKSGSKRQLTYDYLKDIFERRYDVEIGRKNHQSIKKKYGIIFNPFYFIMIYHILKKKGLNILPQNDETIDDNNNSDLNFDIDIDKHTQYGYSGQQTSTFTTNSWKVITNLLEMLYGKYDNRNPKSITFMSSILKYLYALFLETVQITQSIDDGSLLPDCAIDITTLDNKNFFYNVFQVCNRQSQMRGGSRDHRKSNNPCKTADESISTITKMLTKKQNIICELIKFTLIEINKTDKSSLQSNPTPSKQITDNMLINA